MIMLTPAIRPPRNVLQLNWQNSTPRQERGHFYERVESRRIRALT